MRIILSLLLASACAAPPEPDPCGFRPDDVVRLTNRWVPVGTTAGVSSRGEALLCAPWQIVKKPQGSRATFPASAGRIATFTPDLPGTYEVGFVRGGWSITREIEAFVPMVILEELEPFEVPCSDAEFVGQRLACVSNGLHVVGGEGQVLSASEERRPFAWGVDVADDLVATASTGCPACEPCCATERGCNSAFTCLACCTPEVPPAVDLYRVSEAGALSHLWSKAVEAEEVSFANGRLAVSLTDRTELFDVEDPTDPELLGCVTSNGVPLLESDRLWVFDFDVTSWSLPSTPDACDTEALSRTDVSPARLAMDGDLVVLGDTLFVAGNGLESYAVHDGFLEKLWSEPESDVRRLAHANGWLYALTSGSIIVFDVSDPRAPKPVATLEHARNLVGNVRARGDELVVTGLERVRRFVVR